MTKKKRKERRMCQPLEFEKHYSIMCEEILKFSQYKDDWRGKKEDGGYGGIAPSKLATERAYTLLGKSFLDALLPDRVTVDSMGGYHFYWFVDDYYALVAINNKGEVAIGHDNRDGSFDSQNIDTKDGEQDEFHWPLEVLYMIHKNFLKPRGWEGCYAADFVCGEKE